MKKSSIMRLSVFIVALVVGIFILQYKGCAGSSNVLTLYTTLEEPLAKALFDEFKKETGIRVKFIRLSTGEAVARMEAEQKNPQVSIWVGGVGLGHIKAKNKGMTLSNQSSQAFQKMPEAFKDPEGYWVGIYVGPLVFATNQKRAKEMGIEPPKSWEELADPKYKKMIRVAHPSTSGTGYNVITTIVHLFGNNEEQAFSYLKKLTTNVNRFTKSGSAPGKDCSIGETTIAIGYRHDLLRLKEQGAPIEITVPQDGTGFEVASMSLIKETENAKKLYEWILGSKKAREILASWHVIPLFPDGQNKSGMDFKAVHQDTTWDANNEERLVERWKKEVSE